MRSAESLPAWLFETARLTAKNVRRKEEKHMKRKAILQMEHGVTKLEPAHSELQGVLDGLNERYRTALSMRFEQGL